MNGPGTAVRVTTSRREADEWAVVLAAAGIPHWQRQRLDGWALIVPPDDAATALNALAVYDQESVEPGAIETAPARPWTIVGAVVALLLVGFFAITGPRAGRSAWFEHGSADAARVLAGEWWRTITALTLHADAPHLAGNAVGIAVLMTAVCWRLGPGLGAWLLLVAGAAGNALSAAAHGGGQDSVGAAPAGYAAVGILAALRIDTPSRAGAGVGARKRWVVVAAALALLAMLGTGPHADVLAHLFGFAAGAGLGLLTALTLRREPSAAMQWLLVAGAAGAVAGAWRLAF
jgi:membrane associated rhomboid family serine protease